MARGESGENRRRLPVTRNSDSFAAELPLPMLAAIGPEIAERDCTPRKARFTAYDLTGIAGAA